MEAASGAPALRRPPRARRRMPLTVLLSQSLAAAPPSAPILPGEFPDMMSAKFSAFLTPSLLCPHLDLIYAMKFTQPPLLCPLFHDHPPPSNADIISGSSPGFRSLQTVSICFSPFFKFRGSKKGSFGQVTKLIVDLFKEQQNGTDAPGRICGFGFGMRSRNGEGGPPPSP